MIVDRLSSSVCRTSFYPELPREIRNEKTQDFHESATDFFHTGSGSTILHKDFYRINLGFKSPQTLFGSSGPRGAQLKPEASKRRTISGRALWAPKRLLQFGSGKQMLVKLVMPEIGRD